MNKRKYYIVLIVILINVVFYGCDNEDNSVELGTKISEMSITEPVTHAQIYVHLSGAVKQPGVYGVDEGARLYQVIKLAGGLKKSAKKSLMRFMCLRCLLLQ